MEPRPVRLLGLPHTLRTHHKPTRSHPATVDERRLRMPVIIRPLSADSDADHEALHSTSEISPELCVCVGDEIRVDDEVGGLRTRSPRHRTRRLRHRARAQPEAPRVKPAWLHACCLLQTQDGCLRGHGTQLVDGKIVATVCGVSSACAPSDTVQYTRAALEQAPNPHRTDAAKTMLTVAAGNSACQQACAGQASENKIRSRTRRCGHWTGHRGGCVRACVCACVCVCV